MNALKPITITWHTTPESVHTAYWQPVLEAEGLSPDDIASSTIHAEAVDGETVELEEGAVLECWGFFDGEHRVIHAWAAPDADPATVIRLLAHEIGHGTGEQCGEDIEEEARAEAFGVVAAQAFDFWQQRGATSVQPASDPAHFARVPDHCLVVEWRGSFYNMERIKAALPPLPLAGPTAARPPQVDAARIVEQIAGQWDGCEYDGENDIGECIRTAGKRLIAEAGAATVAQPSQLGSVKTVAWLHDNGGFSWPDQRNVDRSAAKRMVLLEDVQAALAATTEAPPPDPVVMQYLALTDAMHYEAGDQLLSPEEYAAALYADAMKWRVGSRRGATAAQPEAGRYTEGYNAAMAVMTDRLNDALRERDEASAECLSRGVEIARLSCEVDKLAAATAALARPTLSPDRLREIANECRMFSDTDATGEQCDTFGRAVEREVLAATTAAQPWKERFTAQVEASENLARLLNLRVKQAGELQARIAVLEAAATAAQQQPDATERGVRGVLADLLERCVGVLRTMDAEDVHEGAELESLIELSEKAVADVRALSRGVGGPQGASHG